MPCASNQKQSNKKPSLPERLREFRLSRDLTYPLLAMAIGIGVGTLHGVINNGRGKRLSERIERRILRYLEAVGG